MADRGARAAVVRARPAARSAGARARARRSRRRGDPPRSAAGRPDDAYAGAAVAGADARSARAAHAAAARSRIASARGRRSISSPSKSIPAPARIVQFSLLERAIPSPETLATLTARLDALVGEDRCGSPVLLDSHRPDAFEMRRFNPTGAAGDRARWNPDPGTPSRPVDPGRPGIRRRNLVLRRFRPPIAVRVGVERGRPVHVAIDRKGHARRPRRAGRRSLAHLRRVVGCRPDALGPRRMGCGARAMDRSAASIATAKPGGGSWMESSIERQPTANYQLPELSQEVSDGIRIRQVESLGIAVSRELRELSDVHRAPRLVRVLLPRRRVAAGSARRPRRVARVSGARAARSRRRLRRAAFHLAAKKAGIKAIIGAELTIDPIAIVDRDPHAAIAASVSGIAASSSGPRSNRARAIRTCAG